MALKRKPHTLTLEIPQDAPEDGGSGGPETITVAGLFVPTSASTAFEQFGVTADVAYLFLCDTNPAPEEIVPQIRGEAEGILVSVAALPYEFRGIGNADHCQILLTRRRDG